jgi:Cyclin, N-terminal domain
MPGNFQEYQREYLLWVFEKSKEGKNSEFLSYTVSSMITPYCRESLMNWVLDLAPELRLSVQTCLLACSYIDIYLTKKPMSQLSGLELIGITALSLSAKINEGISIAPSAIMEILDSRFSIDAIVIMEVYMLKILEWKLAITTPCDVVEGLIEETINDNNCQIIKAKAFSFAAYCFIDSEIAKFGNYNLGIASICMSLDQLGYYQFRNEWMDLIQSQIELDRGKIDKIVASIQKKISTFNTSTVTSMAL